MPPGGEPRDPLPPPSKTEGPSVKPAPPQKEPHGTPQSGSQENQKGGRQKTFSGGSHTEKKIVVPSFQIFFGNLRKKIKLRQKKNKLGCPTRSLAETPHPPEAKRLRVPSTKKSMAGGRAPLSFKRRLLRGDAGAPTMSPQFATARGAGPPVLGPG